MGAAAFTLELVRLLAAAGADELVGGLGASPVSPLWGVALKLLIVDPLATAGELADTVG